VFIRGLSSRSYVQVFVQDTVQAYRESIVLAPRCPLNEQWVDQGFGSGSYDFGAIGTSNQMDAVISIIGGLLTDFNIHDNRRLAS